MNTILVDTTIWVDFFHKEFTQRRRGAEKIKEVLIT
jgi:hypothetical protein